MRDYLMWIWGIGAVVFVVATVMQRRAQRKFEQAEASFLRATATYEELAEQYERELAYQEQVRQTAARQ